MPKVPVRRAPSGNRPAHAEDPLPDAPPRPRLDLVMDVVERVFGIDHQRLHSPQRGTADVAQARQVAMYLAHVTCRVPVSEVGRAFGRDRTTVSHACGVIEDHRDDPSFDTTLELLVGILRHMTSISHTTAADH